MEERTGEYVLQNISFFQIIGRNKNIKNINKGERWEKCL